MPLGNTFTLTVKVDFVNEPLSTTLTWTDISAYVLTDPPISVVRGRDSDLEMFAPGRATLLLNDADGRFDPRNASSPYGGGAIVPMRRIQILFAGYEIFTGFVEDWLPLTTGGTRKIVQVTALDAIGAIFGQYTLGNELFYSGTWTSYPSPGDPLQFPRPGNRALRIVTTGVVVADTLRIIGYDGGGVFRTENLAIGTGSNTYTSGYNWRNITTQLQLLVNDVANTSATIKITVNDTFPSELSDNQLGTLLQTINWPSGWRADGITSAKLLSAYTVDGGPMLYALERLMWSEGGVLFVTRMGYVSLYTALNTNYTNPSAMDTVSDGSTAEVAYRPYSALVPVSGVRFIRNDVRLDTLSGLLQSASDYTSISTYNKRTLARSDLSTASDGSLATMAANLVTRYKSPVTRYNVTLTSSVYTPSAMGPYELGRGLNVRYQTHAGGSYQTFYGRIEKLVWSIGAIKATLDVTLSPK